MIPVVLIVGFLGSGKTTWLKQIAQDYQDRRFVYLVNDFASIDVDGELVQQAGRQVLAISGGSIFCTCLVTEFIQTLRSVSDALEDEPEAVIIEASGMADPRVIHRMLQETGLDQRFEVKRIIALADPGTFHKLLKTLPNVRAQVECADTVLISKADRHAPEVVDTVREQIRAIQPAADCRLLVNGQTDLDLFATSTLPPTNGEYAQCKDPHYHRFTLTDAVPSLADFERKARATQEGLYRAKGFVRDGTGHLYAVNWSSSGFQATPWPDSKTPLRVVCIADPIQGEQVERQWTET